MPFLCLFEAAILVLICQFDKDIPVMFDLKSGNPRANVVRNHAWYSIMTQNVISVSSCKQILFQKFDHKMSKVNRSESIEYLSFRKLLAALVKALSRKSLSWLIYAS